MRIESPILILSERRIKLSRMIGFYSFEIISVTVYDEKLQRSVAMICFQSFFFSFFMKIRLVIYNMT